MMILPGRRDDVMFDPSDILSGKVLIIDDNESSVLLLERMLRGAGYASVASTTDPRQVCELHRKNRYDLILLDLQMPGMDGFQVMQDLKAVETEGYLPVLVLSARSEHRRRALQMGAKDFLSKPFDQVEVLTRIHNMLEVRLLLRESRSRAEQMARQMTHSAQHDSLTGLPNRLLLSDRINQAITVAGRHGNHVAVL